MTTKILKKDKIRSWVLRVLSGYCFQERRPDHPEVFILSPWISDVQLEIDKVREIDRDWFNDVYGIGSINLPYALLLLKLDFGADIAIVTLPPTEKHHHANASSVRILLDFLDEIGCNVYINPDLHSKLILSNDMALLGSFNLSFPALWGREEVGVNIDDLENLKTLEGYVHEVIGSSKPYGYTFQARRQEFIRKEKVGRELLERVEKYVLHKDEKIVYEPIDSVTRGWLFEEIINANSDLINACGGFTHACHEFLFYHFKTILSYDLIRVAASNVESFYSNVFLAFLKSSPKVKRLHFFQHLFNYQGRNETNEILDFLATKFVRTHVPKISSTIMPMSNELTRT